MSVEKKIQELLSNKKQLTEAEAGDSTMVMQGSSEKASFEAMPSIATAGTTASKKASKDTSKSAAVSVAGDTTQPMQGSSKKADMSEMDEDDVNLGAKSAAGIAKDTSLPTSKGDAKTVKTPAMEETESEEEVISEVDVKSELNSIFGEDLSEEFRQKATSIFEAAVIARVNSEMEKITEKLQEQNEQQLNEYKEALVEKVDSYLTYVVEQWMEENQIAIESGLRNEITEQFISGLKNLFVESYIEVPEEKYNVIDDLTEKVDTVTSKLNEAIEDNIEISKMYVDLKKKVIFEQSTKDLAATEVDKLEKLIEGVEFESEELFAEKLSVIKENYFPKESKKSPEQTLVEETETGSKYFDNSDVMSKYMQAISRSIKAR